jgi:adenylate kinase
VAHFTAMTGTPGTGKTSAARIMAPNMPALEVQDLASRSGQSGPSGGPREVDLDRLGRWMRRNPPGRSNTLVVGHLAHLLPVQDVVILRCHPLELARRLKGRPGLTPDELRENVVAEAIDLVAYEALRTPGRCWEIDTTHRTPAQVAREALRLLRRRPVPKVGTVDWLSDPTVTAYLLP